MPRAPRQVLEGVPHHVVLRGNNRRRLFSYPRDYSYFIWLMREHVDAAAIELNGCCLMQNHVHLLLTPLHRKGLAAFIKGTAQRYAQYRIKRFSTTGKLFEQRYRSKPVKSEQHLAVATAYIDLNPVRASIVEEGSSYRWSTLRIHAGMGCLVPNLVALWTPTLWYERLGRDPNRRASAYRDWLLECLARDEWETALRDPEPPTGGAPTRPNRSRAAS